MPRPHQFFGVKAAQERIAKREGWVIWHTQGSGKSIVYWIGSRRDQRSTIRGPHPRAITDRDELDKQIEGVMKNAGAIGPELPSPRITSRAEFVQKLGALTPRLLASEIEMAALTPAKSACAWASSQSAMLRSISSRLCRSVVTVRIGHGAS